MNKILLTKGPLCLQHAYELLSTPSAGGLALFVGTTRQWTGDRETVRLVYDAYPAMAEREVGYLIDQAVEQWSVKRVVVMHRLGEVPVAEASVIIGVAAAHRAEAFEACRYLIDELKKSVPIWKREIYADGEEAWI